MANITLGIQDIGLVTIHFNEKVATKNEVIKLVISKLEEIEDEEEVEYLRSEKFKEDFAKQVEADTWGKGRPKIYMNDNKQIVEHWSDGRINVIKNNDSKKDS